MSCYVGIDIGAVSATAALLVDTNEPNAPADIPGYSLLRELPGGEKLFISDYRRTRGKPIAAATEFLEEIIAVVGLDHVRGVVLTGSGAKATAVKLEAKVVNEFRALATGLATLDIQARTVFEIGGEASKYLLLERNSDGDYNIQDYSTNGDCAAGTGSFIDQQAGRLQYNVEDIGEICNAAERSAQIAGRCSVFAKSDMIHSQQKGYTPAEVLRGLCNAVARNFRSAVVRSHPVEAPVVFVGGVTANSAVVRAMEETFDVADGGFAIPPVAQAHIPAVGAAAIARRQQHAANLSHMNDLRASSDTEHGTFPTTGPLVMDNVLLLRDKARSFEAHGEGRVDAYMGIDIGSVSTNVVVIDVNGAVIEEIYTRTQGRPIEVVAGALREIESSWGGKLNICGVGTTGSGRELIGELIGADTVNDEITAHKTGATFIGQTLLDGRVPDTIFEIGGQDSKYISLQDGVVVDFTMNDACAAGTGSFLEERAEELDIAIKGEFAELALSSKAPIRLGERCTVFMERDVNSYMQRGASKRDLVAGLAYSVVYNYINRVVRGRHIGDCIFFQGGTAYNNATAAAFSIVTGKQIIVPPHNGVIGAIGSALLAKDKMTSAGNGNGNGDGKSSKVATGLYVTEMARHGVVTHSRFRGYDMEKVDYTLKEFTCNGCSNNCQIQQFDVEGEKTYWGDKCSEKFRKRVKSAKQPVIEDLMAFRQQRLLGNTDAPALADNAPTVGIPLAMWAWEFLPFWRTLMERMGFKTILSDPTNKKIITAGLQSVVAEPCFPIIVAHGHVDNLIEKGIDYILMPNIISLETNWKHTEAHLCPWHQTMPFVIRRAPQLAAHADKFLCPMIPFREGRAIVQRQITDYMLRSQAGKAVRLTKAKIAAAVEAAFLAQDVFKHDILAKGAETLDVLRETSEPGIVLVGRSYNTHDAGMNLSVGQKLRDFYGVNCIPLDFLDTADVDIRDVNDSMFWVLGRKILAAAKIVGDNPNLHIIYITNFKCGPDSFIKHFIRTASGKPFLSLQFDGHSNDAGMMTRCEAYLDSKGILRPQQQKQEAELAAAT
ncbi:MAG: acyl-CoA dehydratase activase [Phycisphaerae bacterium]|nr:acyl-CoA dehydratase activase [Phycisphaerae bacterium]